MKTLKVKKENVLNAASQSPLAKSIISKLFPEVFEYFEVGGYYVCAGSVCKYSGDGLGVIVSTNPMKKRCPNFTPISEPMF